MAKILNKFLNTMRLNDDNYDDDYDDTYDDGYDDDYDDYSEPEPASKSKAAASSAPKEKYTAKTTSSDKSKIVHLKSNARPVDEVCVVRPSKYEDAQEIIDILAARKTAVLNLEGSDYELAQQIIDFVSGGCYALKGNFKKVTNYIFIITPEAVEISGDIDLQALGASHTSGTASSQFQMKI